MVPLVDWASDRQVHGATVAPVAQAVQVVLLLQSDREARLPPVVLEKMSLKIF